MTEGGQQERNETLSSSNFPFRLPPFQPVHLPEEQAASYSRGPRWGVGLGAAALNPSARSASPTRPAPGEIVLNFRPTGEITVVVAVTHSAEENALSV